VIIQEHGQRKGDDLLASVRIIGRSGQIPFHPYTSICFWLYNESRVYCYFSFRITF
jgi:hypothetical protein